MRAENFEDAVDEFNRLRPFQPYTVVLIDGDRVEVDSPSALTIRNGTAIHIGPGGVPSMFDHESVSRVIADLIGGPPP